MGVSAERCQACAGCRDERLPHTNHLLDCEGALLGLATGAMLNLPRLALVAERVGGERDGRQEGPSCHAPLEAKWQTEEKRLLVLMLLPGG